MKLSELMTGVTPNASYEGFASADDMVLAVNFGGAATIGDYLIAQEGITEHSGTLEGQTKESQYIRTGKNTIKTGTARTITVNGERYIGDAFQDKALSHEMKFGKGSDVIKDYVYFCVLTGKGEKGKATVNITADPTGVAGDNYGFSMTLNVQGTPEEFTYNAAP